MERRDRELDLGIDELGAHLSDESLAVSELPSALIAAMAPEGSDDDIAILLARICDKPSQQTAVLDLPPTAAALGDGRHFATDALAQWSLPDALVEDATLIVSELLTNAVVHGAPPIRLRLRRTPKELAIEVDDNSSAMPRKLRAGPNDLHGRGLAIVAAIGSRWAARANGHGKTVWSSLTIPS